MRVNVHIGNTDKVTKLGKQVLQYTILLDIDTLSRHFFEQDPITQKEARAKLVNLELQLRAINKE
jgi:hypothetical protein